MIPVECLDEIYLADVIGHVPKSHQNQIFATNLETSRVGVDFLQPLIRKGGNGGCQRIGALQKLFFCVIHPGKSLFLHDVFIGRNDLAAE